MSQGGQFSQELGYKSQGQQQAKRLPISRQVLYKRGHQISQLGYYIVEISTESGRLFIAAYSAISPESYTLFLT